MIDKRKGHLIFTSVALF